MLNKKIEFTSLRHDFPIFTLNKSLIYLDSGASTQKPLAVINAINQFYSRDYANIHRGIYKLCGRASDLYDAARESIQHFIGAKHKQEIIFLRGTTEAINLVATLFGKTQLTAGDEIILSTMEHHSNIVPWYLLTKELGIVLKVIPVNDAGELEIATYKELFSSRTKMVAITHASNVLGTINPIKELTAIAHQHNVPILIDGAQAVARLPINVAEIDCDFYVFSGHKLYGPTGSGVLYAKKEWLEIMPPFHGGGGMIETVHFDEVTFAAIPNKFEAGTPDIAGAIGLGAAINYLETIGINNINEHEQALRVYAEKRLDEIPQLRMIGQAKSKVGVISFVMEGIHPHDIGTVLDNEDIAVRAGHHCAMPLMTRFKVPAMVRVSLGLYNNEQDIDALVSGLKLVTRLFK